MQTMTLPEGAVVDLLDVSAARVGKHLWSNKYYVAIEFRDGSKRRIVERLARAAAEAKRVRIVTMIREAREVRPDTSKIEPRNRPQAQSKDDLEDYRTGFEEGRSAGYADGRQSILLPLIERREALISQQLESTGQSRNQRRYLRHAISILTDVIQCFSPTPTSAD